MNGQSNTESLPTISYRKALLFESSKSAVSHINGIPQDVFVMICIEGSEKKLTQQQWIICITCAYIGRREVRVAGHSLSRVIGIPNGLDEQKKALLNGLYETPTHSTKCFCYFCARVPSVIPIIVFPSYRF